MDNGKAMIMFLSANFSAPSESWICESLVSTLANVPFEISTLGLIRDPGLIMYTDLT